MALADALIGSHFRRDGDRLTIGGVAVDELARTFGTPFYAYDAGLIRARYRALADAVAGFAEVHYSIKANPNPAVVRVLVEEGAGLEVASGAEFQIAIAAGASPERILFAGPGKGEDELRHAIEGGIGEIHLESVEEMVAVAAMASERNHLVNVAVRVNPAAAAQGGAMRMGGKPAAFGIDEEALPEFLDRLSKLPRLSLTGIHMFAGTQILDADVLVAQWSHGLDVARTVSRLIGRPLESIDLGGGLGIPYHAGDGTLDLDHVAEGVRGLKERMATEPELQGSRVLIEPGRWLVGPAGVYVMAVRAVKSSRGQRFLVCDGGMHHHLAASGNLGQVVKRDYPIVAATKLGSVDRTPTTIVGPLCTPLDTLGRQTPMPEMQKGDLVAVLQSGAYGLTASPTGFLSHPLPAEVLVENGHHRRIDTPGRP
ncbi:MAG: type III PLP-dependent enzyme [Hyphomicrobium sp.]|nr:type III PLP-dependent enzyme [Hyphomicrobium sp.]